MRTIKFRGRSVDTGDPVYGDFIHKSPLKGKPAIYKASGRVIIIAPESLVQLVGYDADGKEVYEGDLLLDLNNNTTFRAVFEPDFFKNARLKEVKDEED